ncbi:MAG: DUF3237 domain-containing protein [Gemmatimonadetes bacterium]|nr:DUF3237 domain-containing protein [Gemmatimonadota bacterium]
MSYQQSPSRRAFTRLSAIALTAASVTFSQAASAQSPASDLESEFFLELLLDVDPQLDAGPTSIAPVTGGTFGGPAIQGIVHPGGADWITQVAGHRSLDVRITLETDDGEFIYMSYTGIISSGENGLYWRVRPIFQTASEKYDWLNHTVFIGKNKQVPGKVAYDIFRIL